MVSLSEANEEFLSMNPSDEDFNTCSRYFEDLLVIAPPSILLVARHRYGILVEKWDHVIQIRVTPKKTTLKNLTTRKSTSWEVGYDNTEIYQVIYNQMLAEIF